MKEMNRAPENVLKPVGRGHCLLQLYSLLFSTELLLYEKAMRRPVLGGIVRSRDLSASRTKE